MDRIAKSVMISGCMRKPESLHNGSYATLRALSGKPGGIESSRGGDRGTFAGPMEFV